MRTTMVGQPGWRLFVAAELPASLRRDLTRLSERLRGSLPPRVIRWVPAASIHLTLRFLGSVPRDGVPAIVGALKTAAATSCPFTVRPGRLGSFGGKESPRVVWLGLEGDEEGLRDLAGKVQECLALAGFPPEERTFHPHLTLGRVRERRLPAGDRRALAAALAAFQPPPGAPARVAEVVLFRSHLEPGGARHEPLARIVLSAGAGR